MGRKLYALMVQVETCACVLLTKTVLYKWTPGIGTDMHVSTKDGLSLHMLRTLPLRQFFTGQAEHDKWSAGILPKFKQVFGRRQACSLAHPQ